jgi:hypothetical protein
MDARVVSDLGQAIDALSRVENQLSLELSEWAGRRGTDKPSKVARRCTTAGRRLGAVEAAKAILEDVYKWQE